MTDKAPALPALPVGISLAEPDERQKYNESIQKVLTALEGRSQIPWFQMAAAFADPGRTGSAMEGFGRGMGVLGKYQEEERARELPVAQMRAQLAGQQYEASKEEKALNAFASALGTTPQNLQQGMTAGQFNPAMMQRLNAAMPMFYGSPKIMEMAKTMFGQYKDISNYILEQRKAGVPEAKIIAEYGKGIIPLLESLGVPAPAGQASSGQTTTGRPAGSPISVPYTTGNVAVAADANNPSGIKPGGKFAVFETPAQGVLATQQLVGSYLNNQGRNTPETLVGTWVTGKPTEGANVQDGRYVESVRKELESAGVKLDDKGRIPNTPEANAAVTRAIIMHESGPERAKAFLPLVGTNFGTAQTQERNQTTSPSTVRTATEAIPPLKIEADRILSPTGEVLLEQGESSFDSWKNRQAEFEKNYYKQKEDQIKFEREQISNAGKERSESFSDRVKEVAKINPDNVMQTLGLYDSLDNIVNGDPRVKQAFGLLMKQGAGAAMYELAKNGIKINNFGIGVDAYPAFVKNQPVEVQESLRQAEMILAKIFTQVAKEGKSAFGPAISNFDILTQKEQMASIRDTAKIINGWLAQERAMADQKLEIGAAYGDYIDSIEGTNKKPYQFFNSKEYKDLSKKYGQIYRDLAIVTYGAPK